MPAPLLPATAMLGAEDCAHLTESLRPARTVTAAAAARGDNARDRGGGDLSAR
ncbi:hypothetical protein [Lysobacter silvisoli]|uniref:hypothetical protein n=1 Tax=Lysobacter silvisoli TaxID=2293254 RepID=UPI001314A692|nr:hypothetical protein [Lysobacter silvisoli]